jgi:restriction system protein
MAIPDYQTLMLPLLRKLADQKTHEMIDLTEELANEFSLTEDERQELLPSGGQRTFHNRAGWARTYMKKAGLLESPERGFSRITQRGLDALAASPKFIGNKFLAQYPEFQDFQRTDKTKSESESGGADSIPSKTPREMIEAGANLISHDLATELLSRLSQGTPEFFERSVIDVLLKMGYGGSRKDAGQAVGRSGDGGIDGIIKEDKLGLDVIYVQAKRWEANVGRPTVQAFVGSLEGIRAQRGIIITTSHFSKDAHDYAKGIVKKVVLIDGEQLAQLMIEHDVGVTTEQAYIVKRIDSDYFLED